MPNTTPPQVQSVNVRCAPLTRWRSHKVVEANKIFAIEPPDANLQTKICLQRTAPFNDGLAAPFVIVGADYMTKHNPQPGGYFVRYEDGYCSFSPAAAFEAGYRSAGAGMSFGEALEALKAGKRVARSGWNGKGMWLSLSGDGVREITADKFWSANNADYARLQGGCAKVLPCITMRTASGEILMVWLASQTDMLSEDWTVLLTPDAP